MTRADVRKTYKLYIGGAFPRSESGHTYVVNDAKGKFLANAALGSRKDARDAVVAARAAFSGWAGRTAYNRAPGDLPDRGAHGRPPAPVRRRTVELRRSDRAPGVGRAGHRRSTGWSGTPAGPTS